MLLVAALRIGLHWAELLARRILLGDFQKRVLVQHLLDFLAQFQRRELQQPDRLLQLRRQRQMLRDAKRQALLHGVSERSEGPPRASSASSGGSAAHAVAS